MHFNVVLSEFIHPCSKKWRRAQFSIRAELTRLSVCVRFRCVCVRASDVRARASDVCVCASDVCVCASDVCVCASDVCVCASDVCVCASDVCVCVLQMCVRALQMCARKTSHTALDCYSNNPERLICSPCAFGQSLYRVLIRKIKREYTRWW